MRKLELGDLLIVQSIDRLGRNYGEILKQWRIITKEKKADIVILEVPLLGTKAHGRDLTGTFIADLVLRILSNVAQTEWEFIRKRQVEGIREAQARGVKFGAPRRALPKEFTEARKAGKSGTLSLRKAARTAGMSHMTFYRRCAERCS